MHIYFSYSLKRFWYKNGSCKKYKTIVFLVFRSEFSKYVIKKQKTKQTKNTSIMDKWCHSNVSFRAIKVKF